MSLAISDSSLQVNVTDTGEGISADFLPHVFDRFRQADASTTRRHGGLGLGLSIVRQLVELHGGTVRAGSGGRGQGTTFAVTLPISAVGISSQSPSIVNYVEEGDLSGFGHGNVSVLKDLRVLIVDDEPDARDLLRRLLQSCQAKITTAESVEAALEVLARERFDLILSDIGMPGRDGYDLIAEVRKRESAANKHTPAIALTAFARSQDRTRALRAGFQNHIAKPVEPSELIAAVASLARRTLVS